MKLWQALDKAIRELKTKVRCSMSNRDIIITIEDDPMICLLKKENDKYLKSEFSIDIRDWENLKKEVDRLISKEV